MDALGSMNVGSQSEPNNGWTNVGSVPKLLFDESDRNVIASPNASILLKLYSSLDEKGKGEFKTLLTPHLRKDSEYASIAYLIFFVLYRIGFLVDALNMARKSLSGDSQFGYSNLIGLLSMIVSREYLEIDPKTYESIELILQNDTEHNFRLTEKINLAKLKHLEAELSDVNPEVNTDRDKVVELWGRKFSDPQIPILVSEIEEHFREGEFSATKFASCVGRIRVLLVEIAKRVALSVEATRKTGKVSESSGERYFFDYLKDTKHISDAEWNILRSLYDLASENGAHALTSNREYARLIKNMAYEFVLLLLSKNHDIATTSPQTV